MVMGRQNEHTIEMKSLARFRVVIRPLTQFVEKVTRFLGCIWLGVIEWKGKELIPKYLDSGGMAHLAK